MTAHYTGNYVDYTDRVTREVVLQIQDVFGSTKPFEYNFVIGQEDNDEIYEFAGKFRAAHSAGENDESFGVLFLLGVGEDPTPRMIDKWRWLRDVLIADGSLRPDVEQLMHFQMPGAATLCPGNIRDFWPQFLLPFHPPIQEDEDMALIAYYALPPLDRKNDPHLVVIDASVRYRNNSDVNRPDIPEIRFEVATHGDQYDTLLKTVKLA